MNDDMSGRELGEEAGRHDGELVPVSQPAFTAERAAAPEVGDAEVDDTPSDFTVGIGLMQLAGLASIGAGVIHAGVLGIHAEHVTLTRLFVACAVLQIGVGLWSLVRGGRLAACFTALINVVAVGGWLATRLFDISWIEGLEQSEKPQFTDSVCAALGAIAVVAALAALVWGRTKVRAVRLGLPAWAIGSFAVVAMLLGSTHSHSQGEAGEAAHTHGDDAVAVVGEASTEAGHAHGETVTVEPVTFSAVPADASGVAEPVVVEHGHGAEVAEGAAVAPAQGIAAGPAATITATWPRPYDPTAPIDVSGVAGVTRAQELRASALIRRTQEDLPRFADVSSLEALGYRSIGDSSTGFEHYINYSFLGDDKFLDPTSPESLVYQVEGDQRTLVSAMFIANGVAIDDPELEEYGGSLMQWHVHENLCWKGGEGGPRVVGVVDTNGNCPAGSVNAGGGNPMVHVWIAPHECGPFAALEGHGAGQAAGAGARTDQCAGHDHGAAATGAAPAVSADAQTQAVAADGHAHSDAAGLATPVAYDPTMPIDLSGTPGVTPQQQAFAENLVSVTLVDLPQWSDSAVAEAAGFHSIGDGATGHEHFIQWDWINDDVFLDPDHPESLVYEPQADGSRKLVSAMYMLPNTYQLENVPDWGGALMQWHIHNNLCFTADTTAARVGGITNAQGECTPPLVKFGESPMIHVWITPNKCGPFSALEGLGAGQVAEGETQLCDSAHGSHEAP